LAPGNVFRPAKYTAFRWIERSLPYEERLFLDKLKRALSRAASDEVEVRR
jgi:hypothetical protein